MSINQDNIYTTINGWISRSTSIDSSNVILANQNKPRPSARPYIVYRILSAVKIGRPNIVKPDTNGMSNIIHDIEFTLAIKIIGGNGFQSAMDILDSMEDQTERNILNSSNLVFVDTLLFSDEVSELETEWESQFAIDILFRTVSQKLIDVGLIDNVNVKETYKREDNSIIFQNTFLV